MKANLNRDPTYSAEDFQNLLRWLDADQQRAGEKYEDIRQRLVKLFAWQHVSDPEQLVDEVIDRVTSRLCEIEKTYKGEPGVYFYAVARNVLREHEKQTQVVPLEDNSLVSYKQDSENSRRAEDCLSQCLLKLPPEKRELVLAYYSDSKESKIEVRNKLAAQLGVTQETLRVRIFRLRLSLEKCIEACIKIAE